MKQLCTIIRINALLVFFLFILMVKFGYAIPLLGIRSDKPPVENGIVITRIYRGMPADKAGMQVGDILSEVRLKSGISLRPVKSLEEMRNFLIKECKSGDKIKLVVYRGTKQIVTSVQLVENDPQFIVLLPVLMHEWLGMYISEDVSGDTVRLAFSEPSISLSGQGKQEGFLVQYITRIDSTQKGKLYPDNDLLGLEGSLSKLHSGSTAIFYLESGKQKEIVLPVKTYDYQLFSKADKYFMQGDKKNAYQLYMSYYNQYSKTFLAYASYAQSVECLFNLGETKDAIKTAQNYFRQEPGQELERPTAMIIDSIEKAFAQNERATLVIKSIKDNLERGDNKAILLQLENLNNLNKNQQ